MRCVLIVNVQGRAQLWNQFHGFAQPWDCSLLLRSYRALSQKLSPRNYFVFLKEKNASQVNRSLISPETTNYSFTTL